MSSLARLRSLFLIFVLLGGVACGSDAAIPASDGSAESGANSDAAPKDAARDAVRGEGGKSDAGKPPGDSGADAGHDASTRDASTHDVTPGVDAPQAHDTGVDGARDASSDAAADSRPDSASDATGLGLGVGATCTADTDCASQLCKPVVIGVGAVCVTPCASQTDCAPSAGFFCEPLTAGSSQGYCIPQSPAHCLACTSDSDCGSLSEVCFEAPGDDALACNIDCSLAGAAACPSDYSCVSETVDGTARMLCRPTAIPACLDALGGFCDRLTLPQSCERDNGSGTCAGQRTCMADGRFSECNAAVPECKADCSVVDPAGCTESLCAGVAETPTNCGTCGTVCPGYMQPNDNVTCQTGSTCTFSCQGENYDVDGQEANGCEVADSPQGNHAQGTAVNEGDESDCDSPFSFGGHLVSDTRVHETPAIAGFDTASGSAPDWYVLFGVGNTFCENDIVLTLTVTGSSSPACYHFNVITDKYTYSCQTDATGTCGFNDASGGQFSDNTNIYVEVSKTCGTTVTENVAYAVSGHL
jgi:hypothetical protein